jgi:thiol-disulfide isomerase/thioredoxin
MGIQTWQSLKEIKGSAPHIIGATIDAKKIDLAEYQSRPVIIYFWAEWCPICRYETPAINALVKDYQVLSISTFTENKQDVEKYLQDENITMPVIYDENNVLANLYNVTAVPTAFIVDSKGNIQFVEKGFTSAIGLKLRLWWVN